MCPPSHYRQIGGGIGQVGTRGVMIPFFSGIGTGVGIVSKRTGIGIAWNRFQSGIDCRAGIGSMAGINSNMNRPQSINTSMKSYFWLLSKQIV